jgi:hypothetical protein
LIFGKRGKRGKKGGSKNSSSVDSSFVNSLHAASSADISFPRSDLQIRQPNWQLTQSPPRNFKTHIFWVEESYQSSFALSAAGSVVEQNQAFAINQFPGASSMANLFDQFCIYSVMVRVIPEFTVSTVAAPGVTYGRIWTALDFDSNGPISSESAIEQYATVKVCEITPGKSYERFVKPTCSLVTGASNGTSNTGIAMTRMWLNSSNTGTPHFGVRILTAGNQSTTAPVMIVEVTAIFGLRNTI